jgi:hypothetical protein
MVAPQVGRCPLAVVGLVRVHFLSIDASIQQPGARFAAFQPKLLDEMAEAARV